MTSQEKFNSLDDSHVNNNGLTDAVTCLFMTTLCFDFSPGSIGWKNFWREVEMYRKNRVTSNQGAQP